MKYYVTKYWQSDGILEVIYNGPGYSENYLSIIRENKEDEYIHKKYFFDKLEDAISHANILKFQKIKSLSAQIEKLKNMEFKYEERD